MQRTSIARVVLAATAALVLSLGCKSSPKSGDAAGAGGIGSEEFGDGSGSGLGGEDRMGTSELQTVYFDYDMALIRDDQKPTLQTNATAITGHSDWRRVTIEGHCDERGSEEYNLALGERRANAVKRYLTTLGIADSKLDTVSFGESKPATQGHDESAWRWNRRAEFKVSR
jgi:peptidoglycan-associated lipoprotein